MAKFLLTFLVTLVVFGSIARAQGEYETQIFTGNTSFVNEEAEIYRALQKRSQVDKGFIQPKEIQVSLVTKDYMEDGQFGIVMAVPQVVSGCWEFTPLEYEATFIDPYYLDITVKHYQRKAIEVQNLTDCPKGNKQVTAMIALDKDNLAERQIRQIRFSSEYAADYYNLAIGENSLTLIPQSQVIFKARELQGPNQDRMILNFSGSGLVALHVPMANKGENIEGILKQFAYNNALLPTDTQSAISDDHTMLFMDSNKTMLGQIGEEGFAEVGTIKITRPFDSPGGPAYIPVDLRVFATRPGTKL